MEYQIINTIQEYTTLLNQVYDNNNIQLNIIINISASWCLPCQHLKDPIKEYIQQNVHVAVHPDINTGKQNKTIFIYIY